MQAAVGLSSAVLPATVKVRPATVTVMARVTRRRRRMPACSVRAGAGDEAMAVTAAEVDYSSNVSVFPMEACELVGGEACSAQMYPEAKLSLGGGGAGKSTSSSSSSSSSGSEEVEREYLTYDDHKTVFPGEACDDLGGEFCEAPYQMGVSKDAPTHHASSS